jgi:hypothetical protein
VVPEGTRLWAGLRAKDRVIPAKRWDTALSSSDIEVAFAGIADPNGSPAIVNLGLTYDESMELVATTHYLQLWYMINGERKAIHPFVTVNVMDGISETPLGG